MKSKLLMLIPTFVVMMAMSLTACSDKTDVTENVPNVLTKSLTGNWYGEYTATSSTDGNYIKTVQGLQFNADGTGMCTQVECNVASEPLSIFGGKMDTSNGRFHYSSKADGTVTIVRDGEGDKTHPKTWSLTLADSVLRGMDGTTAFQLKAAEDYQQSYLTQWEETLRSGGNSDKNTRSFLTDWARCEKVFINGIAEPQYLPWAANNPAKSDIPEYLLEDSELNPRHGWEMVFCALSNPGAEKTRYFGLYNRYRGTLRVFMYIPDAQAYGNEMAFEISAGIHSVNRSPLFHAMDYGIPADRPYRLWDKTVLLSTGVSKYSAFSWCQTPYTEKTEATGVSTYWHCFDINMSGYTGDSSEKPWRSQVENNQELLSIKPISQNTTTVKLTGSLIGNLKGQFNATAKPLAIPTNADTHRGMIACKFLGGLLSGGVGWANACVSMNDKKEHGGDVGLWLGNIAGVSGAIFNAAGLICEQKDSVTKKTEIEGSVDLKLNANLDLSGVMSSWKSLSDGGLRITPAILNQVNPNSRIGEGCVGLVSAPVIYVSEEDFLSESESASLSVDTKNKGQYDSEDLEEDLRFVTFLDPNSVKIMINKSLYTNIKDVQVTAYCFVDANLPIGHTDSYRRAMKMSPRPTISLGDKSTVSLNTSTSAIKLQTLNRDSLLVNDPVCYPVGKDIEKQIVNISKPKLVTQVGDDVYRYYGSGMEIVGSNIVLEPQCYLPYKGSKFKTPVVPDLVVTVEVIFNCKEMNGVKIIKQFIPEFKVIKHADLKAKRDELQKYYDDSKAGKAVGTVANDASIPVYDHNSYRYIQRNLKMLNSIADKTY